VRAHLIGCATGVRDALGHYCDCGGAAALRCAGCDAVLAVTHRPGGSPCGHYAAAAAWLAENEETEP
jgi:hypothetical protein